MGDPLDALSAADRRRALDACDRFEAAVAAGEPVRAEAFLASFSGVAARIVFHELLLIELEHRLRGSGGGAADLLGRATAAAAEASASGLTRADGSPAVVGPYRLWREVGRGGFGSVFEAHEVGSGRTVAVKIPHLAALLDPAARDRLKAEVAAAGRLDHPNVVPTFGYGEDGAVCYLVSEFVPGGSLADRLRVSPLGFDSAARLMRGVAAAITHGHSRKLLHLDLTPANILLAGDPADPTPRVTDFGLARVVGEASELSASGVVAGTPGYMAPEQAAGRTAADHTADVYALGAVLYELLAGRPPADGLAAAARGYPPRPRRFRPDAPPGLEAIALRCLEPDRRRRYPSADALAADLDRFLAGRRPLARHGPLARVRWAWGRNPTRAAVVTAAAVVAVLLAGGAGGHLLAIRAVNRDLSAAVTDLTDREAKLRREAYSGRVRRAGEALAANDRSGFRRLLDECRPRPGEPDLRGFEWRLLAAQAEPPPHRVVTTLPGPVCMLELAPDGRTAAAGGADGTVLLFDPDTGEPRGPPLPHPAPAACGGFAPDGRRLAVGCADGTLRVWDLSTGRPTDLPGHVGRVQAVSWSADGRRLLSGGRDGSVRLWEAATGIGRVVADGWEAVRTVGWDDADAALFGSDRTSTKDGFLTRVGLPDGRSTRVPAGDAHDSTLQGLAVCGRRRVTAARDGTVRVWERAAAGWAEVRTVALVNPRIVHLSVAADGRTAAVGQDTTVTVLGLDDGGTQTVLPSPNDAQLWVCAVTPDGAAVLTAGDDGAVRRWPARDPRRRLEVTVTVPMPGAGDIVRLAFDPAGRFLIAGFDVHRARIYQVAPDGLTPAGPGHERVYATGFDPAGRPIGIGGRGDVRELLAGTSPRTLDLPAGIHSQHAVAIAADGRTAAAVCGGHLWCGRLETGRGWQTRLPDRSCPGLAVSADRVAVACLDRTLTVWDAATGEQLEQHPTGLEKPSWVALGPGRRVAVACNSSVLLWDGPTAHHLTGHVGLVWGLAFSPDGRTLATAGQDGFVRLWRTDTGSEVRRLPDRPGPPLRAVAFSRCGRYLAASDRTGQVFLYAAAADGG